MDDLRILILEDSEEMLSIARLIKNKSSMSQTSFLNFEVTAPVKRTSFKSLIKLVFPGVSAPKKIQ